MNRPVTTPIAIAALSGRSGTTWLMQVLGRSQEVFFERAWPFENMYIEYLFHLTRHVSKPPMPGWTQNDMLRGTEDRFGPMPFESVCIDRVKLSQSMLRHLWLAFCEAMHEGLGYQPRYYVEKFHRVRHVEQLVDAGVPTLMIRLLRDPRDIVCSILEFDRRRGFYGFGRNSGESETEYVNRMVPTLRRRLDVLGELARRVNTFTVRYEELVLDLPATLNSIGQWLGIQLDDGRVDHLGELAAEHMTSESAVASIGRWHRELKPKYAELIRECFGESLSEFGYDLNAPK